MYLYDLTCMKTQTQSKMKEKDKMNRIGMEREV